MASKKITRYEYSKLTVNDFELKEYFSDPDQRKRFIEKLWDSHQKRIERKQFDQESNYYSLIKDGIQFNQNVGTFMESGVIIEILPKIGQSNKLTDQEQGWRELLYKMVRKSSRIQGKITTFAPINYQLNNFLDIYISYYIKEVEYLLHTGLVKKYHQKEDNLNSLKGKLNFPKHLSKNVVHKEKFCVNYTIYDSDNLLNQILFKALSACKSININPSLKSKISSLLINFPEVKNISPSEAIFNKINYDRKTSSYKNAITLAKFILLELHPDAKSGNTETLAVVFDMNKLYEKYIEVKLREKLDEQHPGQYSVSAQDRNDFWRYQGNSQYRQTIPDIVVSKKNGSGQFEVVAIFDTKWKKPSEKNFPDIKDLRQMFVYSQYYFPKLNKYKSSHSFKILNCDFDTKDKELDNKIQTQRVKRFPMFSALIYPYDGEAIVESDLSKRNSKDFIKYGEFSNITGKEENIYRTDFGYCDVIYLPLSINDNSIDVAIKPLAEYITNLKEKRFN